MSAYWQHELKPAAGGAEDDRVREWASLNGRLMHAEEARISVFDAGFMQGVGLFETMRGYDGVVFRLDEHLSRLIRSAEAFDWTRLPDATDLRHNVTQTVRAVADADAVVRLTVTTGSLRAAEEAPPELTIVATAAPGAKYPAELYQKGVTVLLSDIRQSRTDPTVGHKTTSYLARLASLRAAHARGAFETLWFTNDHDVAEGAISSVFVVKQEQLLTPPLDTPVLPGITRATVIELAVDLGIPVKETPLSVDDLLEADEVFLTNSLMALMPVARIEREPVGNEKPGEVMRQLTEAYLGLVERECAHE